MFNSIVCKHLVYGGTGITNFSIADVDIYREAVRRYGDSDLCIGTAFQPLTHDPNYMALHNLKGFGTDLSNFWTIFHEVKEGFAYDFDKPLEPLEPLEPLATTCTHNWVETQGLFEIYKDCSICGIKYEDR